MSYSENKIPQKIRNNLSWGQFVRDVIDPPVMQICPSRLGHT